MGNSNLADAFNYGQFGGLSSRSMQDEYIREMKWHLMNSQQYFVNSAPETPKDDPLLLLCDDD
jgi:hypothetical protein